MTANQIALLFLGLCFGLTFIGIICDAIASFCGRKKP